MPCVCAVDAFFLPGWPMDKTKTKIHEQETRSKAVNGFRPSPQLHWIGLDSKLNQKQHQAHHQSAFVKASPSQFGPSLRPSVSLMPLVQSLGLTPIETEASPLPRILSSALVYWTGVCNACCSVIERRAAAARVSSHNRCCCPLPLLFGVMDVMSQSTYPPSPLQNLLLPAVHLVSLLS